MLSRNKLFAIIVTIMMISIPIYLGLRLHQKRSSLLVYNENSFSYVDLALDCNNCTVSSISYPVSMSGGNSTHSWVSFDAFVRPSNMTVSYNETDIIINYPDSVSYSINGSLIHHGIMYYVHFVIIHPYSENHESPFYCDGDPNSIMYMACKKVLQDNSFYGVAYFNIPMDLIKQNSGYSFFELFLIFGIPFIIYPIIILNINEQFLDRILPL